MAKGADDMFTFLMNNAGTILTALVLAAVIFLVVRGMVRDRRAGKGGCGGNCDIRPGSSLKIGIPP